MASTDFQKVLCKDPRLMTTDMVAYAVDVGAQNITPAQFNAISQTTSSHTYNINVPSETTLIDRRCMWKSTVTLRVVGIPANTKFLVNYGSNAGGGNSDCLAPFPLHQLCSVLNSTINNNTVSNNISDLLPALLKYWDKRELHRYNGLTPTLSDVYQSYPDALGAVNSPFGGFENSADNDLVPRGAWVLDSITGNTVGDGVASKTVDLRFTVSEPLLISPWIWADPKTNNQAFYGIQNLNFQMTIGSANRVLRSVNTDNIAVGSSKTVSLLSFENSSLNFNFLTPKADGSSLLSARNVVPYYELPRYLSTGFSAILSGGSAVLETNTISLNQIPDSLIVYVRKTASSIVNTDADFALAINTISINFNNQSGILSSAKKEDLYRYSIENGSNQNYYEFSGSATSGFSAGVPQTKALAGSYLMLRFNKDIQIPESYYSSGSLGQFTIQFSLGVRNQSAVSITPEIVIITKNSGIWVNERGTSQVYTGLLTKSDVLEASTGEAVSMSEMNRMVGGGFLDNLKNVAKMVAPVLAPVAKSYLSRSGNPLARTAGDVLGKLGYGRSGAGQSGAGMSGGLHGRVK
jgi:hypothetical protein